MWKIKIPHSAYDFPGRQRSGRLLLKSSAVEVIVAPILLLLKVALLWGRLPIACCLPTASISAACQSPLRQYRHFKVGKWNTCSCWMTPSVCAPQQYYKQIRLGARSQAVLLMKWLLRINRNASLKSEMEKRVFTIPITTFAPALALIIAISFPLSANYRAFLCSPTRSHTNKTRAWPAASHFWKENKCH